MLTLPGYASAAGLTRLVFRWPPAVQAYVAREVDHIVDEHVEWESQGFRHFVEYLGIKKVSGLFFAPARQPTCSNPTPTARGGLLGLTGCREWCVQTWVKRKAPPAQKPPPLSTGLLLQVPSRKVRYARPA